ncbi:MAG: 23S rRNA (guanosine(2251)-2'-O)-methyltransferase RlmB [Deltaproteobacteria bacterium]
MARLVFGLHPVKELLKARPDDIERLHYAPAAGRGVVDIVAAAKAAGVRVKSAESDQLRRLAEGGVHQGVVAEVAEYRYADLEDLLERRGERPPLLVLLDGVSDPHNLGAIVRSAHALGADGVIIPQDRAAGVTAVVAKASAGAIERCRIARVVNLSRAIEQMKEAGLWVAATEPNGERDLWDADLKGPLGLVIGSEGEGIRPLVRRHCDLSLRIPLETRLGSLNASAAAAIVLAEAIRQRRGAGAGMPLDKPRRVD